METHNPAAARLLPRQPARKRDAVISDLAAVLLSARPGSRLLAAVDGVDGAGKTTFADELAAALRSAAGTRGRQVLRIGMDDFHNVRSVRYRRGRRSPEGFWLDSYNLEQFREYVLEPLATGADRFRPRGHDLAADAVLDPEPVPAARDALVLVDGMFLHREELKGSWDFSVFLDVPFDVSAARMARRDGVRQPAGAQRYVGGQLRYFASADPAARADLVLDNGDERTLRVISAGDASYRLGSR
ncbi:MULTISPECIES: uridine kinase [unclassified Arthrobacter]|uniref:uridine kinase n=1 Tax=unclassified Arthrobacter TaxID=235627 RepID=UPI001E59E817|nr:MULTISPECIES: uridine kinase [unclassified Arthrobacter]MCC9146433.1 uridine kinase [Arthrobacter sp. zg-Y919]MDK1277663.1 uridine kinase [Arthrobacter sp. zg.Y919]WIB02376.1 uridine kinase [Arthrobacter sp. zg-Y919]